MGFSKAEKDLFRQYAKNKVYLYIDMEDGCGYWYTQIEYIGTKFMGVKAYSYKTDSECLTPIHNGNIININMDKIVAIYPSDNEYKKNPIPLEIREK